MFTCSSIIIKFFIRVSLSILLVFGIVHAATLRNNKITFHYVTNLGFIPEDYSCTIYQPCSNIIRYEVDKLTKDQTLILRSGRKDSEKVANTFKEYVGGNNNCFPDLPNEMNFAYKGYFSFYYQGIYNSFAEFTIGQTGEGGSNTWRIGGPECHIKKIGMTKPILNA